MKNCVGNTWQVNMKRRHPNYRLVKIHRSYTVEEIAKLFDIHKNTVRHWIKEGLETTNDKRPMLILGHVLAAFLQARRVKKSRPASRGTLLRSLPRPEIARWKHGGIFSGHREVWQPRCHLPGLQFPDEPARQPGQNR